MRNPADMLTTFLGAEPLAWFLANRYEHPFEDFTAVHAKDNLIVFADLEIRFRVKGLPVLNKTQRQQ